MNNQKLYVVTIQDGPKKLLREIYKTREGAEKRARFENGIAVFEHRHGYKAGLYHYVAIEHEGNWRVQRR